MKDRFDDPSPLERTLYYLASSRSARRRRLGLYVKTSMNRPLWLFLTDTNKRFLKTTDFPAKYIKLPATIYITFVECILLCLFVWLGCFLFLFVYFFFYYFRFVFFNHILRQRKCFHCCIMRLVTILLRQD